eukprot:776123-Pelagomonas_calceolata.AAC.3
MLLLLERPHGGARCICCAPTTNTGQASGPGDVMVPCSRDPMEEQAPPNLLSPIAPPEPPYLMDPVGEVVDQVDGLRGRVRSRQA